MISKDGGAKYVNTNSTGRESADNKKQQLLSVRNIPGDVKTYVFLRTYNLTDLNNYE